MQKIVYFILVLVFLIGCGAQNKSPEGEARDGTNASTLVSSTLVLPEVIAIDFPSILKNLSSDIFIEDIKSKIEIEKEQLKLLEQIMGQISNECKGLEECYVDANSSAFLGKIQLNQYSNEYKLSLTTSDKEQISFSWSDVKADVLTVYKKENYQVAMHYFRDVSKQKEALYIEESKKRAKNSLMISLDSKKQEYRLRSNYISTDSKASFNILVKDEVLVEENENIFSLNSDYSNFKEGAYLLLSSSKDIQSLNLVELFEKAQGSFLVFDNKVQGFVYGELVDVGAVIPLGITILR